MLAMQMSISVFKFPEHTKAGSSNLYLDPVLPRQDRIPKDLGPPSLAYATVDNKKENVSPTK